MSDNYHLSITGTFIGSAQLRSALTEIKGEECLNKMFISLFLAVQYCICTTAGITDDSVEWQQLLAAL
jgi:hypothetical protein